jgi:hypothetical protein
MFPYEVFETAKYIPTMIGFDEEQNDAIDGND